MNFKLGCSAANECPAKIGFERIITTNRALFLDLKNPDNLTPTV
jgi:hypothetical protein